MLNDCFYLTKLGKEMEFFSRDMMLKQQFLTSDTMTDLVAAILPKTEK